MGVPLATAGSHGAIRPIQGLGSLENQGGTAVIVSTLAPCPPTRTPPALEGLAGFSGTIGAPGFEPGTSCSQSRRATGLRHTPYSLLAKSLIPYPDLRKADAALDSRLIFDRTLHAMSVGLRHSRGSPAARDMNHERGSWQALS